MLQLCPDYGSVCDTVLYCPEQVPQNSANFTVDSLNSITGRTEALLQHLATSGQTEWAQYLDASGKLRWEKVAVAGHSRASGIVAALAKVPSIADVAQRMIMVGGPGDMQGNVSNITHRTAPGGGGYWRADWMVDIPTNHTRLYSLDPAYTGGCFSTQPNLVAMNMTGSATFDNATGNFTSTLPLLVMYIDLSIKISR